MELKIKEIEVKNTFTKSDLPVCDFQLIFILATLMLVSIAMQAL